MSDDVEDDPQLSEVLIRAFSRMAEGAEQNPDRVSNVLISAMAARAILTALVSQRDERSGKGWRRGHRPSRQEPRHPAQVG